MHHDRVREYGRVAAGVVVAWALIADAALWLAAATMLIKPNKDALDRAGRGLPGLSRRKAARHSQETALAAR